ncbi:hypothetical protein ACNKHO_04275 [Shigella flexneri]
MTAPYHIPSAPSLPPNRDGFAGQRSNVLKPVSTPFLHRRHIGFGHLSITAFIDKVASSGYSAQPFVPAGDLQQRQEVQP